MKLLRDTWLVFGRYFGLLMHNPVWIALGVLQPVLYLVLFAPLLEPLAKLRGELRILLQQLGQLVRGHPGGQPTKKLGLPLGGDLAV